MTLHYKLKSETWPIHQSIDGIIMRQLKSNSHEFLFALRQWYEHLIDLGFHTNGAYGNFQPDFSLHKIISTLPKIADKTTPQNEKSHEISDEHQQLGVYYVIRGSAHGSRYVLPTLSQDDIGRPYFSYLANLPADGWQLFLNYINNLDSEFHLPVIHSATNAFEELENLLKLVKNDHKS